MVKAPSRDSCIELFAAANLIVPDPLPDSPSVIVRKSLSAAAVQKQPAGADSEIDPFVRPEDSGSVLEIVKVQPVASLPVCVISTRWDATSSSAVRDSADGLSCT